MGRMIGTVSMGIRAPIIRQDDNLVDIVTNCILDAMKEDGLQPRDRDVLAMTESIVARVQGNVRHSAIQVHRAHGVSLCGKLTSDGQMRLHVGERRALGDRLIV
mgnify:CR=1 FL=1